MDNLSNSEVKIQAVHGKPGFWRTLEELDYIRPNGEVIKVPTGFITDFASVPRPLWSLLPPFGRYTAAAVLHDFEYWRQNRERVDADRIFMEAMIELNVKRWRRWSMHRAVRMGGWRPWKKKVTSEQQELNLDLLTTLE